MSTQGSVTALYNDMRAGDGDAARRLWERYSPRLAGLARSRLPASLRRIVDGEDVANNVFLDLIEGARQGRFDAKVNDRHDLWSLLAMITIRQAINAVKWQRRQRRIPAGLLVSLEEVDGPRGGWDDQPPDLELIAAETFRERIERLRAIDPELATIALARFEDVAIDEIAARLGCTRCRVARKLEKIRRVLEEMESSE